MTSTTKGVTLLEEGTAFGPRWDVPGRRAWLHGVGVLDPAPDPVLDAIADFAASIVNGPVTIWFRDGSALLRVAGTDTIAGDGPSVTIEFDGLDVGEVRVGAVERSAIDVARQVAAHVARLLVERCTRLGNDHGRPIGVVLVDQDTRIVWVSAGFEALFTTPLTCWLGRPAIDLIAPREAETAAGLLDMVMHTTGRTPSYPMTFLLDDGREAVFEVQADNRLADPDVRGVTFIVRPMHDPDDEYSILGSEMWVLNRLANRRPLDEILGRVVDMVEHRFRGSDVCLMLVDEDDGFLKPSIAPHHASVLLEAIQAILVAPDAPGPGAGAFDGMARFEPDISHASGWGQRRDVLAGEGYRACWASPVGSLTRSRCLGSIDVYRRVAGNPSKEEIRVLVMAARLAGLAIDGEAHERELRYQATHDPLTGLANRSLFAERLATSADDGRLGVLFVDLDRFKLVNDTLGHDFGDDLLRDVSTRLSDAVTEPAVVARFGGDEFTVLVPKPGSVADVVEEGERLLSIISEPYVIRGQTVCIGASAGATFSDFCPDDAQSLVRDADTALYHAKDLGRGRVEAFDSRLLAANAERVEVERALREALETGRIHVEFQPEVRIADRVAIGAEALARCRLASGGSLSPEKFIPVAEEVGLISRVFDVVLVEACRVAQLWNERQVDPFIVWVNLSPQQLGARDLITQIRRTIELSGADPATLGFEVTERGILPDPQEAALRLDELASLGSRLAVDDFGTGYSSLGYLQTLPVDTVKLDRSFVIRAGDDERSRAIVGSVVLMAEAMRLNCVAEGVETDAQLDAVSELGCQIVQGYIYHRSCAAADLSRWLHAEGSR